MSYFQPRSVTWWSGLFAILLGMAQILAPHESWQEVSLVVAAFMGGHDASPAGLIILGTGLIGLRAKMGRISDGA